MKRLNANYYGKFQKLLKIFYTVTLDFKGVSVL